MRRTFRQTNAKYVAYTFANVGVSARADSPTGKVSSMDISATSDITLTQCSARATRGSSRKTQLEPQHRPALHGGRSMHEECRLARWLQNNEFGPRKREQRLRAKANRDGRKGQGTESEPGRFECRRRTAKCRRQAVTVGVHPV